MDSPSLLALRNHLEFFHSIDHNSNRSSNNNNSSSNNNNSSSNNNNNNSSHSNTTNNNDINKYDINGNNNNHQLTTVGQHMQAFFSSQPSTPANPQCTPVDGQVPPQLWTPLSSPHIARTNPPATPSPLRRSATPPQCPAPPHKNHDAWQLLEPVSPSRRLPTQPRHEIATPPSRVRPRRVEALVPSRVHTPVGRSRVEKTVHWSRVEKAQQQQRKQRNSLQSSGFVKGFQNTTFETMARLTDSLPVGRRNQQSWLATKLNELQVEAVESAK